jgi:hypothetical protein
MIQTALGINGNDCTFGDGNTAEEYEAIAVACSGQRRRSVSEKKAGWNVWERMAK